MPKKCEMKHSKLTLKLEKHKHKEFFKVP
uniref:Uncharacterized protein n=1 Tax=Arundo donax TaxID=35708 RepID=A0A0A9HCR8_ARUDO